MLFNKINADIGHVSKQIEISVGKKDRLKAEYMTYTRTLQETEQALAKANTVSVELYTQSSIQVDQLFFISAGLYS